MKFKELIPYFYFKSYAITVSILLLTAWCHARRANHHQDRRNKRLTIRNNPITQMEDRVDRALDGSFGTDHSNPTSFISNNSGIPWKILCEEFP